MRHLIIVAFATCLFVSTASPAPALGDRPAKWEYAELKLSLSFGAPVAAAAPPPIVDHVGGDGITGAASWTLKRRVP